MIFPPTSDIRSLIPEMKTLGDFFGVPLNEVSPVNLYIALYGQKPEWLRQVPKEADLPRRAIKNIQMEHRLVAPKTEAERAQMVVWIVEECQGEWNMSDRWVWFENSSDAVHYQLRWN